jgi:hypothetical protein
MKDHQARADSSQANASSEPDPPIKITDTVLNIDTNESFYDVTYRDIDGKNWTFLIPRELFRSPSKVIDILVRAHGDLPHNISAAKKILEKALAQKATKSYRVTGKTGWHGSKSFVYPGETFGELAGELRFECSDQIDPALGLQSGSLGAWREGLRLPCENSDTLVFAIATAAAGPLIDIMQEDEGTLFHIHGKTFPNMSSGGERPKVLPARLSLRERRLRHLAAAKRAT